MRTCEIKREPPGGIEPPFFPVLNGTPCLRPQKHALCVHPWLVTQVLNKAMLSFADWHCTSSTRCGRRRQRKPVLLLPLRSEALVALAFVGSHRMRSWTRWRRRKRKRKRATRLRTDGSGSHPVAPPTAKLRRRSVQRRICRRAGIGVVMTVGRGGTLL